MLLKEPTAPASLIIPRAYTTHKYPKLKKEKASRHMLRGQPHAQM